MTAVQWLSNRAYELFEEYSEGKIDRITLNKLMFEATEQAKEMEKEQIINAWENERQVVFLDSFEDTLSEDTIKELAEQYYNETYGGIK